MKLDTYETWQVHTKKKFLCRVIYRFTLPSLFPCQHFFCIGKAPAIALCFHSSMSCSNPKGRSAPNKGTQKWFVCSIEEGWQKSWNLVLNVPRVCVALCQGSQPSRLLFVSLQGWPQRAQALGSVMHPSHRHRSLRASTRAWGVGGPGSMRLAGGVSRCRSQEENSQWKQTGSCQSNSSACPLPNVRGAKQGVGWQPAKELWQPAGQIPLLITCLWSRVTRAQGHARPHRGRKKHFLHHLGPSIDTKIFTSNSSGGRMAKQCLLSRSVVLAQPNVAGIRSWRCP